MWERITNGLVTKEDFDDYSADFFDAEGGFKKDIPHGRQAFLAFVGNRVNQIIMQRYLDEPNNS